MWQRIVERCGGVGAKQHARTAASRSRRFIERCETGAKQHGKDDAAHKREAAPVAGEHSQLAKSASNSAREKPTPKNWLARPVSSTGRGFTCSHGRILHNSLSDSHPWGFDSGKPVPTLKASGKSVPALKAQRQLAKSLPPPKEKDIGFVYLATNKAMSGLVKIGMTRNVNERMRDLSNGTGVPSPFQCAYYCEVRSPKKVESILHEKFDFCRWSGNREFFKVDWRAVKVALEEIAKSYPKEKDNI